MRRIENDLLRRPRRRTELEIRPHAILAQPRRRQRTRPKATRSAWRISAVPAARRTGQAAGLGGLDPAEGRHHLRGAATPPARQRHQAHHPAPEPPRVPRGGAARAQRPRTHAVVLPALCPHLPAAAKWCCSTAAGTTAPAWSASWALHRRGVRGVLPLGARVRAHAGALGHQLIKYWFSITDDEQHLRFLGRIHDPLKRWKLSPMDMSRAPLGDYTEVRRPCWSKRTSRSALVGRACGQQKAPAELHQPPAGAVPLRRVERPECCCPRACATPTTSAIQSRRTCSSRRL